MVKLKLTVRGGTGRRRDERKFKITGPGKTVLVDLASHGNRKRAEYYVWWDDVGKEIASLVQAVQGLADHMEEPVELEIDARYAIEADPEEG